jgi:hypothetical protein
MATWTHGGIFCKNNTGRIRWQIVPHRDFLPRDLANRYKSFRAGLTQPSLPQLIDTPTAHTQFPQTGSTQVWTLTPDDPTNIMAEEILAIALSDHNNNADMENCPEELALPDDLQTPEDLIAQARFRAGPPPEGCPHTSSTRSDYDGLQRHPKGDRAHVGDQPTKGGSSFNILAARYSQGANSPSQQ